jgi:uncharacterized membrane protein YkvA (DUF1232 family)
VLRRLCATFTPASSPVGIMGISGPGIFLQAKAWARRLKREIAALWIAARDARTPWYAKLLAAAIVAYALSPIDLIPDFVPVLGYLDDVIILPLGILLAVRLVPAHLMMEFRAEAAKLEQRPPSRTGMVAIIAIWIGLAGGLAWAFVAFWTED